MGTPNVKPEGEAEVAEKTKRPRWKPAEQFSETKVGFKIGPTAQNKLTADVLGEYSQATGNSLEHFRKVAELQGKDEKEQARLTAFYAFQGLNKLRERNAKESILSPNRDFNKQLALVAKMKGISEADARKLLASIGIQPKV
jgi:hypothetical protein